MSETAAQQPMSTNSLPSDVDFKSISLPRITIQAFCETKAQADEIEAAGRDRRMDKTHTNVYGGGIDAAAQYYASAATPNLLIVETQLTGQALLNELDKLADVCDPGTKVMVIGVLNDVELYRALITNGVSEYLVGPVSLQKFISTISRFYEGPATEPMGRTIAVVGAKGGCGSSCVAHNLSWTIAHTLENDVAICDLDLPFGTGGLDFNQDPMQGIWDAVSTPDKLDKTFIDRLLAKCNERLSLLAAPAMLDRTYDFTEEQFQPVINSARETSPVVVLDLPHTWNAWNKQVLASADEVVIVAEPDLANLRNAKNLMDALTQLRPNDQRALLVLNKVGVPKRPEIRIEDFGAALETTPVCSLGYEPLMFGNAANNGQMIAEVNKKHAIAKHFEELARTTMGHTESKQPKTSTINSFLSKLGRK
ncbi:AAA family ATPase [Polycladidibacter stylochi]|uniref:AAA family ATPase n=1 Tax=Polycladidibacter stylochi TaxID=1807766 RepID=UPI00082EE126|nr:AAA family ATPase [Pseudovibrio stylochi]